ncbi:MAG: ABC transporter ATP-binding protein [Pseudomonadota bacterium]
MGSIQLQSVEKWFGPVQVIKGIDLDILDGELIIFVGPSGCGKSTLLRMIAGLEETSRGKIMLDGNDVTDKVPSERELSMVFQSYALYPHLSVEENVGFALKTAGRPKAEINQKVSDAADVLKLTDYMDRRPKDLSGGQRQRVAIGRAIVREPKGFLFDEPLSNLDAALRVEMRFEVARLHKTLESTMIYVTHDQVEAMTLADRIVVLKDGMIMQVGSPRELYESPDNLFVAQFIGSPKMNVISRADQKWDGPVEAQHLGIRPEHISLSAPTPDARMEGTIEIAEYLGADYFYYVDCGAAGRITVRALGSSTLNEGDKVGLHFDDAQRHFFDTEGQAMRGA